MNLKRLIGFIGLFLVAVVLIVYFHLWPTDSRYLDINNGYERTDKKFRGYLLSSDLNTSTPFSQLVTDNGLTTTSHWVFTSGKSSLFWGYGGTLYIDGRNGHLPSEYSKLRRAVNYGDVPNPREAIIRLRELAKAGHKQGLVNFVNSFYEETTSTQIAETVTTPP